MQATNTTSSVPKLRLTSFTFIAGVLLFLLPFVEIKCNNEVLASNTGVGLAFGTDYKTTQQMKSLNNPFGMENKNDVAVTEKQEGKQYISALIALALGIVAVLFSFFTNGKGRPITIIGTLAAILLIVLMIQINADVKDKIKNANTDNPLQGAITVNAQFTPWFYLSLLLFIAGAIMAFPRNTAVVTDTGQGSVAQ
jgi:hypothetical protein